MNFTREPIIETIITPREGFKVVVRSSKGAGEEEYSVDAVEVVSFGNALFFRSQERPKPFLVPVSDYEVVELKEARVVLKKATIDRSIKIGKGKEVKAEPAVEESIVQEVATEAKVDKKKDRRRMRKRRSSDERIELKERVEGSEPTAAKEVILPPPISTLFPPPTSLISESISRYKEINKEIFQKKKVTSEEEPTAKETNEKPISDESVAEGATPVQEPVDEDATTPDEPVDDAAEESNKSVKKKPRTRKAKPKDEDSSEPEGDSSSMSRTSNELTESFDYLYSFPTIPTIVDDDNFIS